MLLAFQSISIHVLTFVDWTKFRSIHQVSCTLVHLNPLIGYLNQNQLNIPNIPVILSCHAVIPFHTRILSLISLKLWNGLPAALLMALISSYSNSTTAVFYCAMHHFLHDSYSIAVYINKYIHIK